MIYDNGHDSQLPEPGFLASITRAQVGGIEFFSFFFFFFASPAGPPQKG